VSNWSADAAVGVNAAARTRLATLANNWPRTCVIVSLSFTRLLGTFDVPEPLALVLFDYANLGIVCTGFDEYRMGSVFDENAGRTAVRFRAVP
jgi:hypothetical protein